MRQIPLHLALSGAVVLCATARDARADACVAPIGWGQGFAHETSYAGEISNPGSVLTISPTGKAIRERAFAPGAVQAAVLAAPGLIVEMAAGLEIHGVGSVRTIPLPPGARFLGYSEGIAAYGTGRELRLRRLANGRDRPFRSLEPRFQAELGRRGIAYASGRKLGFNVWAIVNGGV